MHPLVPRAHDSKASRISNKLMKLPIPAAVPHVLTMESSWYISPVSSSINTKLDRNVSKHCMYPSVPRTHDSLASRVSHKLMKLPIPAAVPHVATTESSWYISPILSSINTKLNRNIPQHRRYLSNVCTQDFVQLKSCSEPNVTVMTWTSNFAIPQPCTATFMTTTTTATTTMMTTTTTMATTITMTTIKYYYTT